MNAVGNKNGLNLRERSEAELHKTVRNIFLSIPRKTKEDPETVLRQVIQEL